MRWLIIITTINILVQADRKVWSDGVKRQCKSYLSVFADIIGQNVDISLLSELPRN
jgi:hypothetical protein